MKKRNKVFIACSLDGYIADKNGGLDWLQTVPNPENIDMGYTAFTKDIDALVMGRNTYQTVLGFDVPWPYEKPVFVLSSSLKVVPADLEGKIFFVNGPLKEVLSHIHKEGHHNLYIDGGKCIQSFLKEDLIDDLILTTIPVLLGDGSPLFSTFDGPLNFELTDSKIYLNQIVQNHYQRKWEQ